MMGIDLFQKQLKKERNISSHQKNLKDTRIKLLK